MRFSCVTLCKRATYYGSLVHRSDSYCASKLLVVSSPDIIVKFCRDHSKWEHWLLVG